MTGNTSNDTTEKSADINLNVVEESRAEQEIGAAGFKTVKRLCEWLYERTGVPSYRTAPSIITRSECELFGISSPRFCIRKYITTLGDPQPTLFNLRRLEWFCKSLVALGENDKDFDPDAVRRDVVELGMAFADSLISLPPKIAADYHVIQCSLSEYYGESRSWPPAVPFLQHMPLGGGMCAQACIFMALCLYEQIVKKLCSVAELTALGLGKDGRSFVMGGFEAYKIAEVISENGFGLTGFLEAMPEGQEYHAPPMASPARATSWLSTALTAYVRSNVPVICLVDLGKVGGPWLPDNQWKESCIWGTNGARRLRLDGLPHQRAHSVLVIGCHRSNREQFLINDPAMYPLLKCSFEQLHAARLCNTEGLGASLHLIPVFPEAIYVPLVGCHKIAHSRHLGLLFSAQLLQTSPPLAELQGVPRWTGPWPGDLGLVNLAGEDSKISDQMYSIFSGNPDADTVIQQLMAARKRKELPRTGWCWLQWLHESGSRSGRLNDQIWIWNAERSVETLTKGQHTVRWHFDGVDAVFERVGNGLFRRFCRGQLSNNS
ncbi:MAG: hypothetical protein JSS02_04300 [Planctomycetes bacterium]|nr:hypothetical protein [Planctomycetota bacterium]